MSSPSPARAGSAREAGSASRAPAHRGAVPPAERAALRASFGGVLWQARVEVGMHQAVLAERAGLSRAHVARLESGERRPSDSATGRLARVLRAHACEAAQVELDVQLQRAAGESLRLVRRRKRRRWTRLAAQVARERPGEPADAAMVVRAALEGLAPTEGAEPDPPRRHRVDREPGAGWALGDSRG